MTEPVLRVSDAARRLLPRVDTIIFDIDGVLLDVSQSIRRVNCLAVPAYLRTLPGWSVSDDLLTSNDIEQFKTAGGFNDDWDLTVALLLLFLAKAEHFQTRNAAALHNLPPTIEAFTADIQQRGGWLRGAQDALTAEFGERVGEIVDAACDRRVAHQLFQELWAGDLTERLYGYQPIYFPGPGWIQQDRPLLDTALLPKNKPLAALTGRTLAEAQIALEMCGLAQKIPLPARGITRDDGFFKPEPLGMQNLLRRLDTRIGLYIGDTLDDLRTVLNFRKLPTASGVTLLSAQVTTGTVPGEDADSLFADADILAPNVNTVLRLMS